MSKQMKQFKERLINIMFQWRKGFDADTQENILEARNEFGRFFILWQAEDEYTVVLNDDITGGTDFDTLEEAKEYCLAYVRGTILRSMVQYYILGFNKGDESKAGNWDGNQFAAMMNDQVFNILEPCSAKEIETLLKNLETESELNKCCECEKCQEIFNESDDDELLPGDPDAYEDDDGVEHIYAFGDTKKPTIH